MDFQNKQAAQLYIAQALNDYIATLPPSAKLATQHAIQRAMQLAFATDQPKGEAGADSAQ